LLSNYINFSWPFAGGSKPAYYNVDLRFSKTTAQFFLLVSAPPHLFIRFRPVESFSKVQKSKPATPRNGFSFLAAFPRHGDATSSSSPKRSFFYQFTSRATHVSSFARRAGSNANWNNSAIQECVSLRTRARSPLMINLQASLD
jgi:hypothetical protein